MKNLLKTLGIVLGFVVMAAVAGGMYISFSDLPSYENKAPQITVIADSASLAEGQRIVTTLCASCHTSSDGRLGGGYMPDAEMFGRIYAPNITQHPKYGIAGYTDGELAYLLRTGIRKDGRYAPPWMPKFPHMSDKDLNSIIAFLRSDHEIVQPSNNVAPPSKASFFGKFLCKVAFEPLPYPENPIVAPSSDDKVAFGKYISTGKFECFGCHSSDFATVDMMHPELSEGYFGGGNVLKDMEGNEIITPNLTMDDETGIGKWTEEEFINAVKFGKRPHGQPMLRYPMMPFVQMTDGEASAVWAYLKTIPVIENPEG